MQEKTFRFWLISLTSVGVVGVLVLVRFAAEMIDVRTIDLRPAGGVTLQHAPASLQGRDSALPESPHTSAPAAFREVCVRCHALPDSKRYTAAEWPAVVELMDKYTRVLEKPPITNAERAEIVDYLKRHARR